MGSANLFAQYAQPAKSFTDYASELDAAALRRAQLQGAQQQNALAALVNADKADQLKQGQAARAAMREAASRAGGDQNKLIELLRGYGMPELNTAADTAEANQLKRKETESKAAKENADAAKTRGAALDDSLKRYRGALDFIDTPEAAARWTAAQYNDPQIGSFMQSMGPLESLIARIPRDPAQFQQWRQRNAIGMDKFIDNQRQQAAQAETVRHNKASEATAAGQLDVSRGSLNVSRQRLEHDKNQPRGQFLDTPDGYVLGDPRTGGVAPVMGPDGKRVQGKSADRALTDSQAKANLFGSRAQEADRILEGLEGKYSPAGIGAKMAAENMPLVGGVAGAVGNLALSEGSQQAEQAQRDFINAVLRRESGAVISPQEFDNARKQYFPQPNDKEATLKQKARNRRIAIEGMLAEVPDKKRGVPSLTSPGGQAADAGVPDDIAAILKKHGGGK